MAFACVFALVALHRSVATVMLPQTTIVWIGVAWAFTGAEAYLSLTRKERAPSMRRALALLYGSIVVALVFLASWFLPVQEDVMGPTIVVLGLVYTSAILPLAFFVEA